MTAEWSGHRDPADNWDTPRRITDDRELWTLPAGTKVRELDGPRRELVVSPYSHQWLWHRDHPVPINDIEMPVEVIA